MEKEELIEEIKELISVNGEDAVEINPNYLEYFQLDELIAIKERLLLRKSKIKETTSLFLDEIYEKTKED
ncbi:hypothetical protein [Halarcobacter anaerophilus]|jgi:hypothetical protein|uniref:Uncharacterized protein n=1 Tax=Halarcobacter anaerophilus TaxID=877500 RepID=A0A4Q0Y2X6_9BACT|nr:hypothetical protein [Halarcobacter anaerophilus]QDF29167.1 hypothetical protein AANAER_1691 [Halarcobacter anaerophilus]RXJ64422.1 hypothetical protein CRV06_00240 [Halarcobacter anaerophilus]